MKKGIVCILLISRSLFAQAAAPDSAPGGPWKHSLVGALTTNQVSFSNWAQGGENALSWASLLDGKSDYQKNKLNVTNTFKAAYGRTKLGDQGMRKTDDRLELESVLVRKTSPTLNPYMAASLKTQFDRGYVYDANGLSNAVSDFFDPGYLTQAMGVRYEPNQRIKTRLGVALREVLTRQFPHYADNPETAKIEKILVQGGLESVTNIDLKLAENMLFTSAIELFDPFSRLDEVAVRNNNTLTIKASKWVTVIMNLQLIQEKRITPRTQLKESLAIGLSYTFI